MTYTKEKRYLVEGMYDYGQVDVLISQSGEIKLWSTEGDDEYAPPCKSCVFFVDKQAYEAHKAGLKPTNIEQIKSYLHHLFTHEDDNALKEVLPGRLFNCYQKGYWNSFHFKHEEFGKIKKAIGGLLEIGPHTIRPSDVTRVTYCKGYKTMLRLKCGEIITSDDDIERLIIKAMFGDNASGTFKLE